jgi:uncharacterized Zn finger protein (UPF0148 family)
MYIWHCPNRECQELGIILFKTDCAILPNGIIKCPHCGSLFSFREIEKKNKDNLKKYFTGLFL